MIRGKIIIVIGTSEEISGKWRLYEWSVNRNLFWGGIIFGLLFLIIINILIFHEYFNNGTIIIMARYSGINRIDIEDASIIDYVLWLAVIILYNAVGVICIFGAIIVKFSLSKKFYIGAELWAPKYTPTKNIEEKATLILCQYLDHNQVLYDIDKSDSTILIQGKNIRIKYFVNKKKDVSVSITPIQPDSIFAKPEKYILPQDILYIIEIIEKAMVTENFMQQPVQRPSVTLIR